MGLEKIALISLFISSVLQALVLQFKFEGVSTGANESVTVVSSRLVDWTMDRAKAAGGSTSLFMP